MIARVEVPRCSAVLVDFLDGFLPGIRSIDPTLFAHNVVGYRGVVKVLGMPVCVMGDEGGFRGSFMTPVRPDFADAPHFERHTPSAMRSGGFAEWARARKAEGRTQMVLGGMPQNDTSSRSPQTAPSSPSPPAFQTYWTFGARRARSVNCTP